MVTHVHLYSNESDNTVKEILTCLVENLHPSLIPYDKLVEMSINDMKVGWNLGDFLDNYGD